MQSDATLDGGDIFPIASHLRAISGNWSECQLESRGQVMKFGMKIPTSKGEITFWPGAIEDAPRHAAILLRLMTGFSVLEGLAGGIYGVLEHADPEAALLKLRSISMNKARSDTVIKAAKSTLPSEEADKLVTLIEKFIKYSQRRNELVHAVWGYSEDTPDIIYRLDMKDFIHFIARLPNDVKEGRPISGVDELEGCLHRIFIKDLESLEAEGHALTLELWDAYERNFKKTIRNAAENGTLKGKITSDQELSAPASS